MNRSKGRGKWIVAGVCVLAACLPAGAGEAADLKAEIADMKARVAAVEAARAEQGTSGDAARLTSMKKKGAIQIGGRFDADIYSIRRDDRTSDSDNVNSTAFLTTTAALFFRAHAGENAYLHVKLDVDDFWSGANAQQDDLLEEAYFLFKNVCGSNWSVRFGKGEAPYGQDMDLAITKSYHHNDGCGCASYLAYAWEQRDAADAARNPHAPVGSRLHPGERDNVFLAQADYSWKDLAKWQFAVFQNGSPTSTGGGKNTRGMHEDRSDDTLLFQSFASRLILTPVENLELRLSVINEHNESMGDADERLALPATSMWRLPANAGEDATADQTAVSFAFDYKCKKWPLRLWGEYQHGWDWRYDEDYDVDIASLGGLWGLTERVDLVLIGEWMGIDAGNNPALYARDEDEDYYKAQICGRYTFDNGIQLRLEYAHEWYENERAGDDERDADTVAFRTTWTF